MGTDQRIKELENESALLWAEVRALRERIGRTWALAADMLGGGGAEAFADLTDTPASHAGGGGRVVRVKADETGLEYADNEAWHAGLSGADLHDPKSHSHDALTPTGAILPFGGSSAPAGYLLCNGAAVSRSTYAALYAVIGMAFGAGNGSTTFNVPDLRGRFPYGAETSTDHDLGETGGEAAHTLTETEMPSHTHSIDPPSTSTGTTGAHGHSYRRATGTGSSDALEVNKSYNSGSNAISGGAHAHSINIPAFDSGSAGSGAAHENRPPFVGLTFIIKT
jgi:microcystin-dependent protein